MRYTIYMQYQVPQFIDVEDKIFGPFTFKQFIYMVGGVGLSYVIYRFTPSLFISAVPIALVLALSAALAFYRVNNRPFINVLESAFHYIARVKAVSVEKGSKRSKRPFKKRQIRRNKKARARRVLQRHSMPASWCQRCRRASSRIWRGIWIYKKELIRERLHANNMSYKLQVTSYKQMPAFSCNLPLATCNNYHGRTKRITKFRPDKRGPRRRGDLERRLVPRPRHGLVGQFRPEIGRRAEFDPLPVPEFLELARFRPADLHPVEKARHHGPISPSSKSSTRTRRPSS